MKCQTVFKEGTRQKGRFFFACKKNTLFDGAKALKTYDTELT